MENYVTRLRYHAVSGELQQETVRSHNMCLIFQGSIRRSKPKKNVRSLWFGTRIKSIRTNRLSFINKSEMQF